MKYHEITRRKTSENVTPTISMHFVLRSATNVGNTAYRENNLISERSQHFVIYHINNYINYYFIVIIIIYIIYIYIYIYNIIYNNNIIIYNADNRDGTVLL